MPSINCKGSRTLRGQGFAALWAIMCVMGLGAMASTAEAAPFAYVADYSNNVSVIDTATNMVVATVPVAGGPQMDAVAPDGSHVYVTLSNGVALPGQVSVIDTATNTVTATVAVGNLPFGVAVAPDGKHAYSANQRSNTVSVIDTATNTVTATVAVGK
jgi:YVTN family beta-propeller protein